jgi:peptide/nickel transport system substrate-binding protein
VRQAISYGVNRTTISNVGEDFQQPPVQGAGSLTGITLPLDQSYVTPATSGYVATYDPAKAKQILEAAGWKMGSNGFFQLNGKTLAFSIEDPSAYTDFITDDQIMAQELKAVGMDVTVNGTSVQKWTTDLATGNFQAIAHWGNGGPTPYYLYDNWLDTDLTAPIGKTATGDYERFNNATAEADLKSFAGTDDTATQLSDVASMEQIVATQLPVIPLFYGVAWFEYNTSKFTGWPSPSNPYAPGEPTGPFNEITVLHLKPVS